MASSPLVFAQDASSPAPLPVNAEANAGQNSSKEHLPWWKGITANGYMSLSYNYNTNDPNNHQNQFRVFDFNENEPQLDVAELSFQHSVEKVRDFGFRFDLIAGSGVPEITSAYALIRDTTTGIAHHVDITQMFISYVVPLGKGLRLDGGKFATNMGYEVIGGYDGYNDQYSRGFVFGYGIPFTHTGVKASYSFSSKISAMFAITNGWDDFQRINRGFSESAAVTVSPTASTSLIFNLIHGPEEPHNNVNQRNVGEIVASWKATKRIALALDGIYGHEENGVAPDHDAIWKGLAAYCKYSFAKEFSAGVREEIFADTGGTRTGTAQTLVGSTVDFEYDLPATLSKINQHLQHFNGKFAVRGEFRIDQSDQSVFQTWTSYRKQQFTTAVNLIYLF